MSNPAHSDFDYQKEINKFPKVDAIVHLKNQAETKFYHI